MLALAIAAVAALADPPVAGAGERPVEPTTPAPAAAESPDLDPQGSDPQPSEESQDEISRMEMAKLEAEIESLRLQNQALGVQTRRWSAWLGAAGGVAGAMLTFVLGFLGWRLNRLQHSRAEQDKTLTSLKLEQERFLAREKQNLELFKGLGDPSPRVQLAAASVLLQRLTSYYERASQHQAISDAERTERPTIIGVLIAVVKETAEATPTHRALRKHIADHLVKALGATVHRGGRPAQDGSPLKPYDWQHANLAGVWWEGSDARKVDFFAADFRDAGLARSHLEGAVFYEADLRGAVLKGARLEGCNFFGAKLEGANLKGATADGQTIWPEGFDAASAGVIVSS